MDAFTPRRPAEAARWLGAALAASCLVVGLTGLPHVRGVGTAVVLAAVLACAAGAVACLRGWVPGARWWTAVLLGAVALIVASDLTTRDAGATGLVFFLLPPLVAASQLPVRGAWSTAAASTAGLVVVVSLLLSPARAVVDGVNVAAFTVLLTWLVSRGQERTAALVEELRQQAAVDPLTGLVTRRVLDDAVRCALEGTAAARGNALLIVDVDRFKSVNDTWGHPVGDQALAHVGQLLGLACGPDAVVSRLGGDELAALLPGRAGPAAAQVAEDVVRRVRSAPLALPDGSTVLLTVSVGAAHCPTHATDLEALYRAADAALYSAKRGGRDRSALAPAAPAAPAPATSAGASADAPTGGGADPAGAAVTQLVTGPRSR